MIKWLNTNALTLHKKTILAILVLYFYYIIMIGGYKKKDGIFKKIIQNKRGV